MWIECGRCNTGPKGPCRRTRTLWNLRRTMAWCSPSPVEGRPWHGAVPVPISTATLLSYKCFVKQFFFLLQRLILSRRFSESETFSLRLSPFNFQPGLQGRFQQSRTLHIDCQCGSRSKPSRKTRNLHTKHSPKIYIKSISRAFLLASLLVKQVGLHASASSQTSRHPYWPFQAVGPVGHVSRAAFFSASLLSIFGILLGIATSSRHPSAFVAWPSSALLACLLRHPYWHLGHLGTWTMRICMDI
jgi:hypothetical protein